MVNFRPLDIHPKSIQTVAQGDRNQFRRVQEAFQRVWSDFQNLPKSAMFKTMGCSPGFLLKNGQFPTLANSPEVDTNGRARGQQSIQKGLGGVSESLERLPECTKIHHVENHGLQPRLFCSKAANFRPSRIHPKSTQTVPEAVRNPFRRVQEAFQRVGSYFQDLPKSAMFKRMGYSPGFLLKIKTVNFRHLGIYPRSIQTVAQGVRNPFRRVQEAFQRVSSDFQNLPKSTMFKTMDYSPGFLIKNGQFPTVANSPEIDTNSPASSQKSIQKGLGGFSESLERFPELTKIRHVQNHGLQPRLFPKNRQILDPCEFTRNLFQPSRNQLEIHL